MFNFPSRMYNTFQSHAIKCTVKKAHTGNKPTTIYPCDKLVLMGPFQLEPFYGSLIFAKSQSTSSLPISPWTNPVIRAFAQEPVNHSTEKPKEVETKGCLVKCCLLRVNRWVCWRTASPMPTGLWKESTGWDALMSQGMKIRGTSRKGKAADQNDPLPCNVVISVPPAKHLRLQQPGCEEAGLALSAAKHNSLP